MPDLLSIRDLPKKEIEELLSEAEKMDAVVAKDERLKILEGRTVANMFFEPSTRTNFSFQAAAARLGAHVLAFYPDKSSGVKGESFEDTIRMMDGYADAIVLRHPEEGSAAKAAKIAKHPVINAGDGGNQHPTQTLLDLYTIKKLKGKIEGLNVTMLGDLKYARAMRSLLYALAMFGAKITLSSPPELRMDSSLVSEARKFGAKVMETGKPDLKSCDILYVCRVQKERFTDQAEAERLQKEFKVDGKLLSIAPKEMAILHPLPKVGEISPEIDSDPRAKYFEQAKNGVPVRMAVLKKYVLSQ